MAEPRVPDPGLPRAAAGQYLVESRACARTFPHGYPVVAMRPLRRICRMTAEKFRERNGFRTTIRVVAIGDGTLLTERLRLVPIGPDNADDLWLVHNDDAVVPWYDGWRPSRSEARERARQIGEAWRLHGVHKWIAYDRVSDEVVGRGGLSRTPIDDDWGQLYRFLPDEPWVHLQHQSEQPFRAHAQWVEIGWALRRDWWGRGLAAEIGRPGFGTRSITCASTRSSRARRATTRVPAPSCNASACATRARFAAEG